MSLERKHAPCRYSGAQVEWIKSGWFCPSCGKQDMWQEVGDSDDYYHERSVTCGSCNHTMCCVGRVEDEKPERWSTAWWNDVEPKRT